MNIISNVQNSRYGDAASWRVGISFLLLLALYSYVV